MKKGIKVIWVSVFECKYFISVQLLRCTSTLNDHHCNISKDNIDLDGQYIIIAIICMDREDYNNQSMEQTRPCMEK